MDSSISLNLQDQLNYLKKQIDSFRFFYLNDVSPMGRDNFSREVFKFWELISQYGYFLLQDDFIREEFIKAIDQRNIYDDSKEPKKIKTENIFKSRLIKNASSIVRIWAITLNFIGPNPTFNDSRLKNAILKEKPTLDFDFLIQSSDINLKKSQIFNYKFDMTAIHQLALEMLILPLQKHRDLIQFKQYCELYKREELIDILLGESQKEKFIHDFFNEYFFARGYLPITKAMFGNQEIDSMLVKKQIDLLMKVSSQKISRNDLIIEFKQYIDNPPVDSLLNTWSTRIIDDLNQLYKYWQTLYQNYNDLSHHAYLVIAYNKKSGPIFLDKEIFNKLDAKLHIILIYLGDVSPSEQKAEHVSIEF